MTDQTTQIPEMDQAGWWPTIVRRANFLVKRRWPIPLYRLANAGILVGLGASIEHGAALTIFLMFSMYVVFSFIIEYLLAETARDIEERVREIADQKARRIATELETYAAAEKFLTERLRRNTGAISVLRTGDPKQINIGTSSIAKLPAINETLRDLCESLSVACSKTWRILQPDAAFRATYTGSITA
jgi:hypothetical protein